MDTRRRKALGLISSLRILVNSVNLVFAINHLKARPWTRSKCFSAILLHTSLIFVQQVQYLLYLGVACGVSYRLRKVNPVIRLMVCMATYFALGFLGLAAVHAQDIQYEFQRPLFSFFFSLLPSCLVAFGVLFTVQSILPSPVQSQPASPTQTPHPAPGPKTTPSDSNSSPIGAIVVIFFLGCGLLTLAVMAWSVNSSPKVALKKPEYLDYAPFYDFDWSRVKADKCSITLGPQGISVVTRYGFQVIAWEICRELQVASGQAQFGVVVPGAKQILLSPLEEPTGDQAWMAANYWQPALKRLQELKLMTAGQSTIPLRLFRSDAGVPPRFAESFPLPGQTYRGLSLEMLRSQSWHNGVTLCKEGLVVRDICAFRSVAWSDIRKLVVDVDPTVLRVVCGEEGQTLGLLTSERATQRLKTQEVDELQEELISVLGLKLSKEESTNYKRVYVPSRGSLEPPSWPHSYQAHLGKAW